MEGATTFIKDPVTYPYPRKQILRSHLHSIILTGLMTALKTIHPAIQKKSTDLPHTYLKDNCSMSSEWRFWTMLGKGITHVCLLMGKQEVGKVTLLWGMGRILGLFLWCARRYLIELIERWLLLIRIVWDMSFQFQC